MPEIVNTSHLSVEEDSNDKRETMISVQDVSMMFNIASAQLGSLKEYAIAAVRRELSFKEFWALNDISFEVKKGDVYGIMGTNGSGKSTMLKIIAGVLEPTKGKCKVTGNIAPLIELGAGFDLELTARENIYLNGALLGYSKKFIDQHFDDIVEFSEVRQFLDMPIKNYSSGMVARIAFAIATIMVPDVLIVDEVLAVGDFMFRKKCERRIQELIRDFGVTVLIVSHNTDQVRRLCNKAIWIEKGHTRMIGSAQEVCDIYSLVGGRTGSSESEKVVLETIENTEIDTSAITCNSISGDSKFGTAAKLSEPDEGPTETVILTPGEDYVDSLIATGLASLVDAKVLLSGKTTVPDATADALSKLQPKNLLFVGQPDNQKVDQICKSLEHQPASIDSVSDFGACGLSLAVYEYGKSHGGWGDTCVITPEFCVGDQFAILPVLSKLKAPLFFTSSRSTLDQSIIDAVLGNFKRVMVLAGESCIASEKLQVFKDAGMQVQRFLANNEYEANDRILEWLEQDRAEKQQPRIDRLVIVPPRNPEDAYCVGNYAARKNAFILLISPNDLDFIANGIQVIEAFGGSIRHLDFIGDSSIFGEIDKTVLQRTAASAYIESLSDASQGDREFRIATRAYQK